MKSPSNRTILSAIMFMSAITQNNAANLRHRPFKFQSDLNLADESAPLDGASRSLQEGASIATTISSMEERIRETFRRRNLYKDGDKISVSWDNVSVEVGQISLGEIKYGKGLPKTIKSYEQSNKDTKQRRTWDVKESADAPRTMTAEVTRGISYKKGDIVAKTRMTPAGSSDNQKRVEFSLSKTTPTSTSTPRRVSFSFEDIDIPPRTRIEATTAFNVQNNSSPFTNKVEINSKGLVNVSITRNGKTTKETISLQNALWPKGGGGFSYGKNENQVIFTARGELSWTTASRVRMEVNYFSLDNQRSNIPFKTVNMSQDI